MHAANNPNVPAIRATITALDTSNAQLDLVFANGRHLAISQSQLSIAIAQQAMMHGLKQKLVDAAAISRNSETGRPASLDDKYEAVKEVFDRLLSGDWNKRREGGAGGSGGLLFQALCRVYANKTPDEIRAYLETKTDKEKAALRKNAKIAPVIEEIRAEQAGDDDGAGDDLLAGLED